MYCAVGMSCVPYDITLKWLHYVLTRQQASILHSIGKAKEAVRGENFIVDDVTAALDNFSIK